MDQGEVGSFLTGSWASTEIPLDESKGAVFKVFSLANLLFILSHLNVIEMSACTQMVLNNTTWSVDNYCYLQQFGTPLSNLNLQSS